MSRTKKGSLPKCFEVPILAGKYKGRKILIPNISTTRSSKSILRESLFDTLQFDIIGSTFVEVFAGSGSVGIEALSRGAKIVYFIEKNRAVYEILRQNIENLGIESAYITPADSFEYFGSLLQLLETKGQKSYFYFDPPFSVREGMGDIYTKTVDLIASIPAHICKMVIIEHMSSLKLPESIGVLYRKKNKKFGKSSLSYYLPGDEE